MTDEWEAQARKVYDRHFASGVFAEEGDEAAEARYQEWVALMREKESSYQVAEEGRKWAAMTPEEREARLDEVFAKDRENWTPGDKAVISLDVKRSLEEADWRGRVSQGKRFAPREFAEEGHLWRKMTYEEWAARMKEIRAEHEMEDRREVVRQRPGWQAMTPEERKARVHAALIKDEAKRTAMDRAILTLEVERKRALPRVDQRDFFDRLMDRNALLGMLFLVALFFGCAFVALGVLLAIHVGVEAFANLILGRG